MKRWKPSAGVGLLILLLLAASVLEAALGPIRISIWDVVTQSFAYVSGSRSPDAVVMGAIRLPRLFVAAFVGAGLASSGAVLQAVFRNPMADPGIIGVSSGASLGAVICIAVGLTGINQWFLPAAAFVTGTATVFTIYRLGTIGGRTAIHSLLLAGVAVGALCSAGTTFVLSLSPLQTLQASMFWLMGDLDGRTWQDVWIIMAITVFGLLLFQSQARALDILSIGEEQAEGVGVPLQLVKRVILVAAALVVGACVSVSGVIGFVGLIVPHLIRIWIGPAHRWLIPASALGGAFLVVASDIVARMALSPIELNTGVVTSCLGAPFFLYLLRRQYAHTLRR